MIYTLLLGHRPENRFDGYDPHRHVELIAVPPAVYLDYARARGIVYPPREWATVVINPWLLRWTRQYARCVGYNYGQVVGLEHYGLYSLGEHGEIHDGIDAPRDIGSGLPAPISAVQSSYINAHGFHATADVFAVDSADVLRDDEVWLASADGTWRRGQLTNGTSYYGGVPYREIAAMAGRPVVWDELRRSASF